MFTTNLHQYGVTSNFSSVRKMYYRGMWHTVHVHVDRSQAYVKPEGCTVHQTRSHFIARTYKGYSAKGEAIRLYSMYPDRHNFYSRTTRIEADDNLRRAALALLIDQLASENVPF